MHGAVQDRETVSGPTVGCCRWRALAKVVRDVQIVVMNVLDSYVDKSRG